MKLIILSCSATKRPGEAEMKTIDRYDGPMWRTLRAQLARNPVASAAVTSGDLLIWALSARYGFLDAIYTPMPNYEKKMTLEILAKMARDPSYDFQRIHSFVDDADAVLFAGGEMYRDAMWRASGGRLSQIVKIDETDGSGIGEHRAQLGAWLSQHFPYQDALAA
ncbi:MAG: hypothetical protein ABIV36_22535 [Sphingobium limneticum]